MESVSKRGGGHARGRAAPHRHGRRVKLVRRARLRVGAVLALWPQAVKSEPRARGRVGAMEGAVGA